MTYPDRDKTIAILSDWKKQYDAIYALMNGIKTSMGLDIDGPMFDTVWKLFDAYTGAITVEVGDLGEWLIWFQSENDMGASALDAGYDGKTRPIKTLKDLYRLIAESRKRGVK